MNRLAESTQKSNSIAEILFSTVKKDSKFDNSAELDPTQKNSQAMELLQPEHPPHLDPTRYPLRGLSSPSRLFSPETAEEDTLRRNIADIVYVAVGKTVDKALSLLQWSFKQFAGCEICLLHIHQPSPLIPTLLGKLPASQANSELVKAYRREEREKMRNLLDIYLKACARTKVKASVLVTEADQVARGILELINRHCIKKLVMGAVPESCMKMRSSSKAFYASKKAPAFCEIWFVNKGKHAWVREAFERTSAEVSGSRSFRLSSRSNLSLNLGNWRSRSARNLVSDELSSRLGAGQVHTELPMSPRRQCNLSNVSSSSVSDSSSSSAEKRLSSNSDSKVDEDCLYSQFNEARTEAEASKHEAFREELNLKNLESGFIDAINKVKAFESAHAHEVNLREEAENELRSVINQQEKLSEEKEKLARKLERAMRNVAFLDCRAQGASRRREEVSAELKLVESSLAGLRLEKQKIRRQKMDATRWIERWKSNGHEGSSSFCNEFVGFEEGDEDLPEVAEFSLSELESATFHFSESFKLGQGGNGCVYKGEMLGRTVAIKKLHPHNMQGQLEFQQEVRVLSKLQHPHLVTMFGYCPEAWSIVYEYLPNGSLQDRLFRKTNVSPLSWEIRARVIAEISNALCFLHSSKPEKIVHGDLKPENILLDSELTCKICDFGICRLVSEESFYRSDFNNEPKGAFPYADPEFHRYGILTPKSDVYSFGIIILQLLTGRPPVGLVGEVRKAVFLGKLASILDSTAGECPIFLAKRLANIGLQCCEQHSRDRPDLTPSLVRELEQLHIPEERPVPSFFLCPIFQEIMHDPQLAADGFTYEGEAIRSWFKNGHMTSPMTNLKLNHLHLTPNHGLRLAIQDWLCKSRLYMYM
ncbi:PREDICTED: U-box domain-containing protein 33-like [Tarenaya hassleriana]|uniref:U-box domain-containing protein 33-like n=1 Tax=Tarenaya hassleriana TaxID=28532 RepID=UPI00053C94B8|nr:PREDICTED: U-box domain-containing protein 33-like [Tarenaya hassleriana]